MSEFLGVNGEYYMECPYNRAHQINKKEMSSHLETCREVYLNCLADVGRPVDIQVCCYNPAHWIPGLEIEVHELVCEDSLAVSSDQSGEVNVNGEDKESLEDKCTEPPGEIKVEKWMEEEWEAECTGNGGESEQKAEVGNWEEVEWEENQVGFRVMVLNQVGENVDGSGLSEREMNEIYEELREFTFPDNENSPAFDPWIFLHENEFMNI